MQSTYCEVDVMSLMVRFNYRNSQGDIASLQTNDPVSLYYEYVSHESNYQTIYSLTLKFTISNLPYKIKIINF